MVPQDEQGILENLINIRTRLQALKKSSTESYVRVQDVEVIYVSLLKQVKALNAVRDEHSSEPSGSEPQSNRVDTTLNDVFSLVSLFFLTIGKARTAPASFCQLGSMRQLLDNMNESGAYTEELLLPFKTRIDELRQVIQQESDSGKLPAAMEKLLTRRLVDTERVLDDLLRSLQMLSVELVPIHQSLVSIRKQLAMLAAEEKPAKGEVKALLEELRKIDSKRVDGKFLGPGGSSVPTGQAILSGLLEDSFEIAQDIKAREEDVSLPLKPIFERLSEMRTELERLSLTHRWTLKETDLYNFSMALHEIDKMRVDGKFVIDGEVPSGQYGLLYLLRRNYGLIYRLMASCEPVSEELMPIANKLSTVKKCLNEVLKYGGPFSARDLYPYHLALHQIDSMRKDGKFLAADGSIPEGQAILVAHLSECHELLEMLKEFDDDDDDDDEDYITEQVLAAAAAASIVQALETKSGLSPKAMLEMVRPSISTPNPAGDLILTGVSKYDFDTKITNRTIYLTSLEDVEPSVSIPVVHSLPGLSYVWLSNHTIAYLDGNDLKSLSVKISTDPSLSLNPESSKLILTFPAPVGDLKYELASSRLFFTADVYTDGKLSSVKAGDKAWLERDDDALVYDELFVRHWDAWRGPKSSQIFFIDLRSDSEDLWIGDADNIAAPINGTNLKSPSPDALSDYDVSSNLLVFSAKDPNVSPAFHTRKNIYLSDISRPGRPRQLTGGDQGATSHPVISPDETRVAWLEMAEDGYEADRNEIVVYDLSLGSRFRLAAGWDASPSAITWVNSTALLLTVPTKARDAIFYLEVPPSPAPRRKAPSVEPIALYLKHSSSGVTALPSGEILFTSNSLTSPNEAFVLSTTGYIRQVTEFSKEQLKGLQLHEGDQFHFDGAEGRTIQGWILTPPGFKRGKKASYPLAFLIHGGPQGNFGDSWSTRWNFNVFASQGYVVVATNPTGSTSFGQELTDAIKGNWGGSPYKDLMAGLEAALELVPEIDPKRIAGLGASYGGFMANWIQGHNNGRFSCLVGHDGVFSTTMSYFATEEVYFNQHDMGGSTPWEDRAAYEKWNPMNHIGNWNTPMLLLHGGKDYRLDESNGIAAFTALQKRGVPSRFVYFPDENHWVLKPANSLRWHAEVFRFLNEWIGEDAAAVRKAKKLEALKVQS